MYRSLSAILLLIIFTSACKVNSFKSEAPEPLLIVAGDSVSAAEFLYAYNKNNRDTSSNVESSIRNYLDLYTSFKLKVAEGHYLKVDSSLQFQKEYDQYKSQLVKPYLLSSQVSDSLVNKMYERTTKEVKAAHILFTVAENAGPEDTLKAYNKAIEVKSFIENGADFGEMAVKYSKDPSVVSNKGQLGYFTAFQMVEPFEDQAFATSPGQTSGPVRTRFGYHLIHVDDIRNARGKVLIAHIYKKVDNNNPDAAEKEIFKVYDELQNGKSWNEMASIYSDDIRSKDNGGELQWFGTGQLDEEILNPAFDLEKPGDYTKPVKSRYGWHIIKLIQKQPIPSFKESKRDLKIRLAGSSRMKAVEESLTDSLKNKFGYKETEAYKDFARGNNLADTAVLFYIGNSSFNNKYVKEQKLSGTNAQKLEAAVKEALEEKEVEWLYETNSDFKFLLDEYSDGMVLFEIMETQVWDKANSDTLGLNKFYDSIKDEYLANESAKLWFTVIKNPVVADSIAMLIDNDETWVTDLSKREILTKDLKKMNAVVESGVFDKSDYQYFRSSPWQKGLQYVNENGYFAIIYIDQMLTATTKPLSSVRGEVVSRYQKYLEAKWVEELRNKYEVIVNEELLESIINELEEQRI
ncbi:peptidylprolyl isomerase [Marinigracilibium pacificum]|uniref:PpiC domain-containing protein n=1 Tax=Marinigracilibium pacificum TaxID=2729599 RepID=A0A848ISQ9_9BACT|nr:peptidylprolyl isomerase [Marinigracilibium pacificum]NMM46816.1 hypothetical protein [Marinigracilibium pacificum]